jgi:hypothetical protein
LDDGDEAPIHPAIPMAYSMTRSLPPPLIKGKRRAGMGAVVIAFLLSGCSTLLVDNYRYGKIDVRVVMDSGEPAVGIPMVLYQDTLILAYGRTDVAGKYAFNFVPFGSVGVQLQLAPDYETSDGMPWAYNDDIDLSDGGQLDLLFTGIRRIPPRVAE